MIGDRSSWINFAIALASSTFVAYFIYLSRKNDYPETLRQSTAPAIEQFQRFRDESLRIVYEKLDNARSRCLSLRHSILSPSGIPKSQESPISETASDTGSVSSVGGGFTENPSVRWDISRESAQLGEDDSENLHPDCFLSVPDMIRANEYPCDEITAETDDGFLLGIHRIPNDGPAVLLQHGLLADASNWVTAGPKHALAYRLWEEGYDVYLGNSRGNPYSRRHKSLTPKESGFWHWTFQELARYDIPATVKKVIQVSGKDKIWYIGHSQGSLIAFANFVDSGETIQKFLHGIIALAPILSLKHVKGPWRSVVPAVKNLVHAPGISPDSEFLPKSKAGRWFARLGRSSPNALKEWGSQMTRNFLLKIANFDQSRYVEDRLEVFLSHTPAGTSLRNLVHYAQVIDKREDFISKFDHGNRRNLIMYSSTEPPVYNFSEICVPTTLFIGTEDWLATPEDTVGQVAKLKSATAHILNDFDHLDFIWGKTARAELHPKIIEVLKS